MTELVVYLEMKEDGPCMAHVPELPGCFVRAPGREEALARVPAAVHAWYTWLARYGEDIPLPGDPIEFTVAEEVSGTGPFVPGDAAALFAADRGEVTPDEIERYLRLMAYSRADLLPLVQDLPDGVLDWQPDPESLTIRRVLRHIGNAEQWYLSRIVEPARLPPEWEQDEELPILEFLEMERRTIMERLPRLSQAERAEVFRPTTWTRHPEEEWTARKALRRYVEHEREHTAQVREVLLAWWEAEGKRRETGPKAALLATLAAAREELLHAAAWIPPAERASRPVCGAWTVQDVLGHVADWEWVGVEGLRDMAAGRSPGVEFIESIDAWNQVHYDARRNQTWDETWADVHDAHAAMVEILEGMEQEDLSRSYPFPWGPEGTAYQWVGVYVTHDVEHAEGLREALSPWH